jgi:hypothetical protein
MSHFSVLVVGDDVDEQLAPYDEDRTTAPRREYLRADFIARMAEHYGLDVMDLPALAAKMPEWRACPGGVDARGLYALTSYNSDAKWDWYEVGGRWAGFFLLKAGTAPEGATPADTNRAPVRADEARKIDIDFDGMRADAETRAREVWRAYLAAITGTPEALPAVVFDAKVRKREMSRDAARRAYRAQPRVQAFDAAMEPFLGPFVSLEEFPSTEEDYVSAQRRAAVAPFAYVRNGVWHERGEMGWFGSVANERADDEWFAEFEAMLAALPDDTLLTLVDCHI